tara:strand:+ start:52 stop:936 length:885 start_codon:yes stop_codon:yes gene_type:complete
MKILLILFIIFFTKIAFPETATIHLDITYSGKNLKINADYHTHTRTHNTVAIAIHGTRGFKTMEVISVLSDNLLDLKIDTIAPNISYGINNRQNEFLSCDIEHLHNRYSNIDEIVRWFLFALEKDYQEIILIGHSRGGQDVMHAYRKILEDYPNESKKISSIVLLAPLTDNMNDISNHIKKSSNMTISEVLNKDKNAVIQIDFMNCANVNVKVSSFLSYYNLSSHEEMTHILKNVAINTYIFSASEDEFAPKTHSKISGINNTYVKLMKIDGSDHFFRDLYLDEVIENLTDLIE